MPDRTNALSTTTRVAGAALLAVTAALLPVGAAQADDAEPVRILNPTGGTTEDDGLRILYRDGNFQACYRNAQQFYPPGAANPTACAEDTFDEADTFFYIALPGVFNAFSIMSPASGDSATITNGGTRITDTVYATIRGVRYSADITLDYTTPNLAVDVTGVLRPAEAVDEFAEIPDEVYFYWGADTTLGGNDYGKGYEVVRGNNREIGTSNDDANGLTEWIRPAANTTWTGYFSGVYEQNYLAPAAGDPYQGVDTDFVDSGFGWNTTVNPNTTTPFGFKFGLNEGPPTPEGINPPQRPA